MRSLSPKRVMFEVTETQIMSNPEDAIVMLKGLKSLGVSVAVDDFGTGHSSLSYLKRLPIDKIKIDQSFIRDIPDNIDDSKLTQAIISIGKSLHMKLIAEGVEKREHAKFLLKNGCEEAQGYLYYKPQSHIKIETILHEIREQKSLKEQI